ncbi:MAG: maltose alpha-D-glucosyltransferase [Candidatus Nanopelagicales bacterium]
MQPERAAEAIATTGSTTGSITGLTPGLTEREPVADPLWYKDAVVYELHVKAFFDSNGDGIGDLAGLTQKLDYLADLGVNTIWLLPFYPSPFRDDGYDVSDYRDMHPAYGDLSQFPEFVRAAHERGLRVITELVMNHTSDQHPWFQAARRAPKGSPERDYYVWSDDLDMYSGTRIIFTDTERSNWTWDEEAGQYFWHRFFNHQPDLNFDNPAVRAEVLDVLRFWLDMGVDGFRLDAIPYLIERDGTSNENLRETHEVIKELRAGLDASHENRLFLAEANMWPEDVREYFGDGDECHMAYHFPLMPRMYMAIAQEDRHPIVEILQQTPEIPESSQWAIFLRNHDELTLEMVTSKERDYMWSAYAEDTRARINLGIRRRLAPLMENDPERIKLMNSLLLSMPGSPFIYYGDEIGMGDNFYLGDRDGVRTPMQWTPDRNGGFSRADPQGLYLPPIMDPIYGYEAINVEAQLREPASLLNWTRRMLAVRKTSHAFGRGEFTLLHPGNRKVLAYIREHDDDVVLCVANVSRSAQPVELDLSAYADRVPVEMLGRNPFPPITRLPYVLTLPAHGFFWFKLMTDVEAPNWHEDRPALETLPLVVLFAGWSSLFRERVPVWRSGMADQLRSKFERDLLPALVARGRWYGPRGAPIDRVELGEHALLTDEGHTWLLAVVQVHSAGQTEEYSLPLALGWEDTEEERIKQIAGGAFARVRQQANVGLVADAMYDEAYYRAILRAIQAGRTLPAGSGTIRFVAAVGFSDLVPELPDDLTPSRLSGLGSNSNTVLGDALFLKTLRRLRKGMNPELEVGRFLTEVAEFERCVPVAGHVEYVHRDGEVTILALLQIYVPNQGDVWTFTVDELTRQLDDSLTAPATVATPRMPARSTVEGIPNEAISTTTSIPIITSQESPKPGDGYRPLARTVGRRTAQLHAALARRTGDPAFDPEPVVQADIGTWAQLVRADVTLTMSVLESHLDQLPAALAPVAAELLGAGPALVAQIDAWADHRAAGIKTRYHGSYHLDQLMLVENDVVIMDLEGEQGVPLADARRKSSPLRDVASMLRSFDYARRAAMDQATQHEGDLERMAPAAATWLESTRETFLAGYREEAVDSGLYVDEDAFAAQQPLIDLFELQKALEELRFELDHRPDWVSIPLRGLVAMVQ